MIPERGGLAWMRVAFVGVWLAAVGVGEAGAGVKDGALDLYWIDSEGGGSTLLVTPAGESVLIDAGNPGVRDAARIHRVAREVAGLERIDHLVVTHFHLDHFGGVAELAALMPVVNLWDNGIPEEDPDGRRGSTWPLTSRPYREAKVGERKRVKAGTRIPLVQGATPVGLQCVIARREVWDAPSGVRRRPEGGEAPELRAADSSDNANSSGWLLGFGGFGFYTGGDLTWNVEATLVWPEVLVPEVDLLQVGHHGLDVSNHPRLLRALNPRVSVMNNGPTKGAMAEVMGTLRGLPELRGQFQVHRNLRADGSTNNCPDEAIANHERECAGHFIRCSVLPGGGRFTLQARPGAAVRTFESRGREILPRAGAAAAGGGR